MTSTRSEGMVTDPLLANVAVDPNDVINKLNLLLMSNQMSAALQSELLYTSTTVVTQANVNTGTAAQQLANRRVRLSTIVHLITTSPQFATQR